MTDEQLGTLLEAFANYYWSVPIEYVKDKIFAWHPEVTKQQFNGMMKKISHSLAYHCCLMKDGLVAPELVADHLVAVDSESFDQFIAARIEGPYCDCGEETLLRWRNGLEQLDIPEVQAIIDFGRNELGLDDEWNTQLLDDCQLSQPSALGDGGSWVMQVLRQESFGKIRFKTVEQVNRFRVLGNRLYQALPNPVLKGWRPADLENPPLPSDDIPEKDADIPDSREIMNQLRQALGVPDHLQPEKYFAPEKIKAKIGRNELCPCGSGKKYKKCCGRNV